MKKHSFAPLGSLWEMLKEFKQLKKDFDDYKDKNNKNIELLKKKNKQILLGNRKRINRLQNKINNFKYKINKKIEEKAEIQANTSKTI